MLARALTSLQATLGPDDEMVVVDSASDDARQVEKVASTYGARVVRCDQKGETVARNEIGRAHV